jgi:uncharacterized protein
MDFKGRYLLPAAPDSVLAALRDPDVLTRCLPGAERVEKISDTDYRAGAVVKIGPVKARFQGRVTLAPEPPPAGAAHALALSGEGHGGPAGFARGVSHVVLTAANGATVLEYDAKATIGGRLAQVGQRLIDAAAKSLADEFFATFAALIEAAAAPPAPARPRAPAPAPAHGKAEQGLAPQIWVAGLVAIVVILLIVFSAVL